MRLQRQRLPQALLGLHMAGLRLQGDGEVAQAPVPLLRAGQRGAMMRLGFDRPAALAQHRPRVSCTSASSGATSVHAATRPRRVSRAASGERQAAQQPGLVGRQFEGVGQHASASGRRSSSTLPRLPRAGTNGVNASARR